MQKFSYHTHTVFSDGDNSLEEMLAQAVKLGWEAIGISDHMIIHKNIKKNWYFEKVCRQNHAHMIHDDFKEAETVFARNTEFIRKTAKKYPLKVYIGFEVDYFTYNGWEEEFRDFINRIDHDYLLTGNHFFLSDDGLEIEDIYKLLDSYDEKSLKLFDEHVHRHFQNIRKAVQSGLFNFLAHLDYVRRIPFYESAKFTEDCLAVVKALKESGMGCELSTKGLRRIGDYFPQNNILEALIKEQVPLVISDDAHKTSELGYAFDKAENVLKELDCNSRFILK